MLRIDRLSLPAQRTCNAKCSRKADASAQPVKLIVAASRDYLARDLSANESTHVLDLQDAIALFESGEPRQAADLLEKLAAEMPGYATARVLLARSYERMNDWEPALKAWREAHQIIPNSPVVRRGLQRAARKAASRSPIEHARPAEPRQQPTWEHVQDFDEELDAEGPAAEDAPVPLPGETDTPEPASGEVEAPTSQQAAPPAAGPPAAEPPAAEPESDETAFEPPTAEPKPPLAEPPLTEAEAPAARAEPESEHEQEPEPEEPRALDRDYEDLDRLISELESARIVPRPDLDSLPAPDLEDDIEDVVSETLARIYASQGQYEEAAHVYDLLAEQQPEKAEHFSEQASAMRSRASEEE